MIRKRGFSPSSTRRTKKFLYCDYSRLTINTKELYADINRQVTIVVSTTYIVLWIQGKDKFGNGYDDHYETWVLRCLYDSLKESDDTQKHTQINVERTVNWCNT